MTSLTRKVWGRELNLAIRFEDLDNEGVSDDQWLSFGNIILSWSAIDDSLVKVKQFCADDDFSDLDEQTRSDVFRYVMPQYLFIPREDKRRSVALMCDYRFDPEHGLAIVFENEKLKEIGPQDIVL